MPEQTDTVDRIDMQFLLRICLVAAMGGLLFGYDWVVIGGAKAFYEPYLNIDGQPFWRLHVWAGCDQFCRRYPDRYQDKS